MNWLQKRLNELGYTHQDLQQELSDKGIVRVRATITGWTNGKPISLFTSPKNTKILADVLQWTVLDLFIAAGYDLDLHPNVLAFIRAFHDADDLRRNNLLEGLQFAGGFYLKFQELTQSETSPKEDTEEH